MAEDHLVLIESEPQLVLVLTRPASRKYTYQISLIEKLIRDGVETRFVKPPRAPARKDQLLVQFQGMIAEYERAQMLSDRSRQRTPLYFVSALRYVTVVPDPRSTSRRLSSLVS
jgi:hypothetical protein